MYDTIAEEIISKNKNMAIPWYLMAAYAYYELDDPIISDAMYDSITFILIENWDQIDHFHKSYLTIGDLQAGTFLGKYPSRVKHAIKYIKNQEKKLTGTLEDFFT